MSREIRNGTIIKLENPDQAFIIVDNVIKDGKQYIAISPYQQEEGTDKIVVDYKKISMLELKSDDDYEFVTDLELIKSIAQDMINKQS